MSLFKNKANDFKCFSLALDELKDVPNTAQLNIIQKVIIQKVLAKFDGQA